MKCASVLLAVSCLLSAVKAQPFALCYNSTNNEVLPPQNLYHDSLAVLFIPPEPPAMPIDSVWLDSLFGPPDTVDTAFQCGVAVCCSFLDRYVEGSWSFINPEGMVVFVDAFLCEVPAGDSVIVESMWFDIGNDTCLWTIMCTIPNDSVVWRFRGRDMPGIEEGLPQASGHELPPTVLRRLPPGAVVFDAMGRRVTNPKAGIYFLRSAAGGEPLVTRKVIIQK